MEIGENLTAARVVFAKVGFEVWQVGRGVDGGHGDWRRRGVVKHDSRKKMR